MSAEAIPFDMLPAFPWEDAQFKPTAADREIYGTYTLGETNLIPRPADIPDGYVAYNPSGGLTVEHGKSSAELMYVRIEPNRSDATTSHLGKSLVKPYLFDINHPRDPLRPYDGAETFIGEDAALTKVNRRLPSGRIRKAWLLSYVDAQPDLEIHNHVRTLSTRFLIGDDLQHLEHFADGPEWMKDIRTADGHGPLGTEIEVFGRPQDRSIDDNGNITHTTLKSVDELSTESIADAPIINDDLLPVGSGIWGGVNDAMRVGAREYILASHRAWRTGEDGHGRHYETVLYGYNSQTRRIVDLGVLATASDFEMGTVKSDSETDLSDVVFTGGGINGGLEGMTYGVRDGRVGYSEVMRIR